MKTKLTPELQDKICGYISKGNYIETSCVACGISKQTYFDWLKRGEVELKDGGGIYADFLDATQKADAAGEVKIEGLMLAAAEKGPEYWMAAARIAEARWGSRWARVQRGTLTVDGTVGIVNIAEIARVYDSPPEVEGEFKELKEGKDE